MLAGFFLDAGFFFELELLLDVALLLEDDDVRLLVAELLFEEDVVRLLVDDELLDEVVVFFFFFDVVFLEPLPGVARQKAFTLAPLERVWAATCEHPPLASQADLESPLQADCANACIGVIVRGKIITAIAMMKA